MLILTPNQKIKFEVRDDETRCDELVIKETWVENVYQIQESDFNESNICIDIGANIGSVSLFVASLREDIKVIAYEPQKDNYELLKLNRNSNNLDSQIKIIKKAISNERKTIGISNDLGNSHFTDDETAEQIKAITLEDIFTINKIELCDVMKIDVEGAEFEIINSAKDETLNRIKYLTMEFSETSKDKFGKMIATLTRCFNIHIIGSYERGGQIYARRYF